MSSQERSGIWRLGGRELALGGQSVLMGVLNATPDSFSDGGLFEGVDTAVERGLRMLEEGAGIVDIGGESTRPGFRAVSAEEEIRRVAPVIEGICAVRPEALLSIDTSKATVAEAALRAGCCIVNDVWGFQKDPGMAEVVKRSGAGVVLMRNGRSGPADGSVLAAIEASWSRSLALAEDAGIARSSIVLDPGIGFGTTREEDLLVLRSLQALRGFGFPLLLGASRKRITAQPEGIPLGQRLEATLATTGAGVAAGVDIFRVHDVLENKRFVDMADLIYREEAIDG